MGSFLDLLVMEKKLTSRLSSLNFSQGFPRYPSASSDVCRKLLCSSLETYLEPVENCVLHQSPDPDNCTAAYFKSGLFFFETCVDCVFYETPRVYGCDDGNTTPGDGCNEYC
ncbi:unnamed protein product [Moneuplotes crassus]|uniref:Uncharacterized protein n=1 Tax=Euplotes crassus TaxID=5936 RepID=A0AAD1Y0W2_EUPCR|nr:unnamed protein product [Moneuplotes crassus]